MDSWNVLDPVVLRPAGDVSAAFVQAGVLDYRAAARHVSRLPYGRNLFPASPLAVVREGRGTCSTKHALLRRVAIEQELEVALVVGIYEMNAENTPGVGSVLERYGLTSLPEAHCYLRYRGKRVDVTHESGTGRELVFLSEQDIAPEQIGEYKVALHRQFLQRWMIERDVAGGRDLNELWRIREECIAALSRWSGRLALR
jgi:hypothetical protein